MGPGVKGLCILLQVQGTQTLVKGDQPSLLVFMQGSSPDGGKSISVYGPRSVVTKTDTRMQYPARRRHFFIILMRLLKVSVG